MKKIILICAAVLFSSLASAQPPKGKASAGTIYGEKIDQNNAVASSELPNLLSGKDTIAVKLKGKVLGSCASKGCWLTLQVNEKEEAFVKMKDYAFFVPTDIQGKTVVIEGISYVKTTSVEDLKHYAEDAKKPSAEIDAIKVPKKELRILASGILVVGDK